MELMLHDAQLFAQNSQENKNNTKNVPDNKIQLEREQTRSMIENVKADQKATLDYSNSLGQKLNMPLLKKNQKIETVVLNNTSTNSNSNADSKMTPVVIGQWPDLLPPSDKKLIVNPRPRGVKNDDGSLVYTPDFSRQRLTLGLLNNSPFIDLPVQDLENISASENVKKNKFDIDKSLTLADLVYAGINYSPVIDQAQSQLEIAIARSKSARAELMPKASVRYANGKEDSQADGSAKNTHTTTSSAYRISQPLINIPATQDWMSELSNQDAATWRLHASREAVALSVVNAMINLSTARMTLDFADEQLIEFNRLLEYIESRNQTGASSVADMERTRTRVLQAKQARIAMANVSPFTPVSVTLPN